MTFILGLTGSIGMGKSTVAAMFRQLGVPVHDSDACVHMLYRGKAVEEVEKVFPGVTENGAINRSKLAQKILNNADELERLESIIHPMVRASQDEFILNVRQHTFPLAVLEIPLLFETGARNRCDAVAVVSAPPDIQRARVLSRPGMSEELLNMIHVKQWPDIAKRRRSHFLIDTGGKMETTRKQVEDLIRTLSGR